MEAASHSIKKLKICIKKFSPTSQTLLCSMAPKALIVIWYFACQVKLLILKCSFVVLSCTAAVQTVKFLTATRTTRRQEAMKNYCNSVNCEEAIVQHKVCETGK